MNATQDERMIFVLGMHRSGTSALSGLLNILGFNLGNNLYPPDPDINSRGYWENADIVDVHERLLNSLGSSWSDDRNLPEQWWMAPETDTFRREIESIVQRDFPAGSSWAVKDPRLCRLLPLWRQVLEARGVNAAVIVILRDPREVARSLAVRDGIGLERASLLWLQHFVEAERWSRDYARLIVAYDDLLGDWRSVIGNASKVLHMDGLSPGVDAASKIDDFLSDELRHHRSLPEPSGTIEALALEIYRKCIGSGPQSFEEEALRANGPIAEQLKSVNSWSTEIEMLRRKASQLKSQTEKAEQLAREVNRIKSTLSWRITAPLRATWNLSRSFLHRLSLRGTSQENP